MGLNRKDNSRTVRRFRIRKKISGSTEKPRLSVFRSSQYIYAQIVDDVSQKTLVTCSSAEKVVRAKLKSPRNMEASVTVGKELAQRALSKKISQVVFDRNGFGYHGRIKALADGAREGGLKF